MTITTAQQLTETLIIIFIIGIINLTALLLQNIIKNKQYIKILKTISEITDITFYTSLFAILYMIILIKNPLDIPKRIRLLNKYPLLLPIFTLLLIIYQLITRRYYTPQYEHSSKADKVLKMIMLYGQPTISTHYSQLEIESIHYKLEVWYGIHRNVQFSEGTYNPSKLTEFSIYWRDGMPNKYIAYLATKYIDYWC